MTVADLIQHTCQDHKTARLTIDYQDQQAVLFFSEGTVQHATLGDLRGEEVVYEVLMWEKGDFTLEMDLESPIVTITRSWSGLLLKGASRLDETQHLSTNEPNKETQKMANIQDTLAEAMKIDGAIAVALVDWNSGMTLGTDSKGKFNVEVAAAGNTNVVRAKLGVMKDLKLKGGIEDMLITLTDQYHLIRVLASNTDLFLYIALDRGQANLGLARHRLAALEHDLSV
jgi:hypothetical protein